MSKKQLEEDLIRDLNILIIDFYVKHKKKMKIYRDDNNDIKISYKSKVFSQEEFVKYLDKNEKPSGMLSPLDIIYTDID